MDRVIRLTALATSAATILWLSGCGPAIDTEAVKQQQVQAVADEAAAKEAQLNEDPSVVTEDDFKRGKALEGGGYTSTVLRGGIVAEQRINMIQVQHATNLYYGLEGHFPRSHEEFMKGVIEANGLKLEPLDGPYEYWYNAEDHLLYKRPIKPAEGDTPDEADPATAEIEE